MATLHVPGPSFWHINLGADSTWDFLGVCEGKTRISNSVHHEDVMTDLSGTRVPYDVEFQGTEAMVSGDLVKYNESVLNQIKAFLDSTGAGDSVAGRMAPQAIGSLMRTENRHFGLAIKSGYAGKAPYAAAGMNPGYVFGVAIPYGSFDVGLGSSTKRERVQFRCLPAWDDQGGGLLYTNTMPTLPDPN